MFDGATIAVEMTLAMKFAEKVSIRKLITDNGSKMTFNITKECLFMVTDSKTRTERIRQALSLGVPVVTVDYLRDCVSSSTNLAIEPYTIFEKPKVMLFDDRPSLTLVQDWLDCVTSSAMSSEIVPPSVMSDENDEMVLVPNLEKFIDYGPINTVDTPLALREYSDRHMTTRSSDNPAASFPDSGAIPPNTQSASTQSEPYLSVMQENYRCYIGTVARTEDSLTSRNHLRSISNSRVKADSMIVTLSDLRATVSRNSSTPIATSASSIEGSVLLDVSVISPTINKFIDYEPINTVDTPLALREYSDRHITTRSSDDPAALFSDSGAIPPNTQLERCGDLSLRKNLENGVSAKVDGRFQGQLDQGQPVKKQRKNKQRESKSKGKVFINSPVKAGRRFRTAYPCPYCDKRFVRFSRHLMERHCDQPAVAKAFDNKTMKEDRLRRVNKIRNAASFKHNCEVLAKGEGDLIVARRSQIKRSVSDYLPCMHCNEFFVCDELWRHTKNCMFKPEGATDNDSNKVISNAQVTLDAALMSSKSYYSEGYDKYVLSRMYRDEVSSSVKNDDLILHFGAVLFKKLGPCRSHDITQRLRQLGRLMNGVRRNSNEFVSLTQALDGKYFDSVLTATESLCSVSTDEYGRHSFCNPSIGLKIGYSLLKCAILKKGLGMRKGDSLMAQEADTFIALHKAEWNDTISSRALASLQLRKMNRTVELPTTEDLVTFRDFVNGSIAHCTKELSKSYEYSVWRHLSELVLCSLIVFNMRRGGETSKLLVAAYKNRPNWKESGVEEIAASFSPLEMQLLNRMDLVEVPGKRTRKVPILIQPHVRTAMDLLVSTRQMMPQNPYFFASDSPDEHLCASTVLRSMVDKASLKKPRLMTSTNLRKYIATCAQVMNLTSGEVEWLCNHLGHDFQIDRQFYRQQTGIVEISKVCKLLLAAEMGTISKYKGQTLSEMDIAVEDFIEQDQEKIVMDTHRRHSSTTPAPRSTASSLKLSSITDHNNEECPTSNELSHDHAVASASSQRLSKERCRSGDIPVASTSSKAITDHNNEECPTSNELSHDHAVASASSQRLSKERSRSGDIPVASTSSQGQSKKLSQSEMRNARRRILSFSSEESVENGGSDEDFTHNSRKKRTRNLLSDSDVEESSAVKVIPKKKKNGIRKPWSEKELCVLRFHFKDSFVAKKPPNFASIDASRVKYPELALRQRDQIKTRVWHMIKTGR